MGVGLYWYACFTYMENLVQLRLILFVCGTLFTLLFEYVASNFGSSSAYTFRTRQYYFTLFFEYVAEAVGSRTHAEACGIDLEKDSMCMLVIVKREQTTHHPLLVYNLKGRRCSFGSLVAKEHRQH